MKTGKEECGDVGGIWLCKPVVGCGEGVAEQLRKLITKLLVEGAGKEEVGDIFSGGIAVGTVGGGAGGLCKVSGRGAVATGGAWGAVPVLIIRRGCSKGRVKAVAVPRRVAITAKQNGVGVSPGVNVTGGAGLVVAALLFSSTAVAGSVGGKPVCATAKARHGATVCGGDRVVAKVGLWRK